MNTILQIVLLVLIFSNSTFLMLGKNIFSFKIFKLSWIIAIIDILLICFFFKFKESMILYIVFTLIIVIFSLGLNNAVDRNNSNNLENNFLKHDNRKRFAIFFVYFLLFFLFILTIGVVKNLLFDSPM